MAGINETINEMINQIVEEKTEEFKEKLWCYDYEVDFWDNEFEERVHRKGTVLAYSFKDARDQVMKYYGEECEYDKFFIESREDGWGADLLIENEKVEG